MSTTTTTTTTIPDVLPNLDYNLVVMPPRRAIFNSDPTSRCPVQYHDLIAIDIALLPDPNQSQWIMKTLNNPLIPMGSFPLNQSHFPHMSLMHTIVPRAVLPQLCAELSAICSNFQFVVGYWYNLILSKQHPFYNYPSDNDHPQQLQLKPIPHHLGIGNTEDVILQQFLQSCPEYTFSTTNPVTNEQFKCKSYYQPLFSIQQPHQHQNHSIPTTFDWTIVSPGPMWAGDTTLPYIGYPNPLPNGSMDQNGLNIRLLHDMVTTMAHPYRVSIWEAKPKVVANGSHDSSVGQIDMKAIQTNGDDGVLHDIIQVLYFTGDTIIPTVVGTDVVCGDDKDYLQTSVIPPPLLTPASSAVNAATTIPTLLNPQLTSPATSSATTHPITTNPVKWYTSPQPFDSEPGDISTLKYSNVFDEAYMGPKYNPHITIGSGDTDKVKEFILKVIELDDCEKDEVAKCLKEIGPAHQPKSSFKMKPIETDLAQCTLGVFQLGTNGSCRFPIFKTTINTGESQQQRQQSIVDNDTTSQPQ